jgi:alpha-glucosidase
MFAKTTSKFDAMTVGEVGHSSREESLKYVSAKEQEMNMMFLFDLVETGNLPEDRFRYNGFKLPDMKKAIKSQSEFIEGTDAWSTVFIENHDQPRSISRFGNPSKQFRFQSGKALAILQSTLTGTEFLYQGQEIGMINLPRSWSIDEYLDINTINYVEQFKEQYGKDKDFDEKFEKLMDNINLLARDHARSPVQWDDSTNAGFTTGKPWTRVNDNYKEINAKSQLDDENSLYNFWKKALKLRKQYKDLMIYGSFKILDMENEKTFTYLKSTGKDKAMVTINFTAEPVEINKYDIEGSFNLLLSNNDNEDSNTLGPYEGRVYIIE